MPRTTVANFSMVVAAFTSSTVIVPSARSDSRSAILAAVASSTFGSSLKIPPGDLPVTMAHVAKVTRSAAFAGRDVGSQRVDDGLLRQDLGGRGRGGCRDRTDRSAARECPGRAVRRREGTSSSDSVAVVSVGSGAAGAWPAISAACRRRSPPGSESRWMRVQLLHFVAMFDGVLDEALTA